MRIKLLQAMLLYNGADTRDFNQWVFVAWKASIKFICRPTHLKVDDNLKSLNTINIFPNGAHLNSTTI